MATLLQQQLAAIAVKSTHQLDLRAQRTQHSKSLLFPPKVAANQSLDSLYHLCAQGFKDLCLLDARFKPFANDLFCEQSKDEDRTQMSSQENARLDAVIKSFLGLVCGKLLLNPAQKAVEWLVRRFGIHEYNKNDLILAFLPYHSNDIFTTMLSILPKQISPMFKFLQPYIASLTCPPRHAILYASVNNANFFSALCQFTLSTASQGHHSVTLIGFWASIVAQSVHGQLDRAMSGRADIMKQRQEDVLLRVLPVLQDALSFRDIPELYLGSCMIITILVAKTHLEENVLEGLMDAIAQTWSVQTLNEGLVCLGVIAQEKSKARLTSRTASAMLKLSDLATRLEKLSQQYDMGKLYQSLALYVITRPSHERQNGEQELIDAFLQMNEVQNSRKQHVARTLLRRVVSSAKSPKDQSQGFLVNSLENLAERDAPLLEIALRLEQITPEELESRIHVSIVLPLSNGELNHDADDVEMHDTSQPLFNDTSADDYKLLVTGLATTRSFLSGSVADDMTSIEAFVRLAQSKQSLELLERCEAFNGRTALSNPAVMTFLARIWSGKTQDLAVRTAALRIALGIIQAHAEATIDLQALLPYAITALGDESRVIRRTSAELVLKMAEAYHVTSSKSKVTRDIDVWARTNMYDSDPQWLTSQDAYRIINTMICPVLEECILDASHIQHAIFQAVNATDSDSSLKTNIRTSFCTFLFSHAVLTRVLQVRSRLLSIAQRIGKVGSNARTRLLIPATKIWAGMEDSAREKLCQAETLQFSRMDALYVDCLTSRTSEEIGCLKAFLLGELSPSPQFISLAAKRLRQLWPHMKPQAQQDLVTAVLDMALDNSDNPNDLLRRSEAKSLVGEIVMPTEALMALIDTVPDMAQMTDKQPVTKRRRTSKTEESRSQAIDTADLQKVIARLTLVLEIVEANKPEKHTNLLKGLFKTLSEIQNYRIQLGSDLVYLQQMVIGSLLAIVNVLKDSPEAKVDRSILRTDLIVECVRSTSSTLVHNTALLLISSLASWVPDLVLHSVMPIFTFMSSTILRQSDDYSAHIIDQTVSRVVPPLIKSLRRRNQDLVLGAAELLLSFTAAFEHVPRHRRLRLFKHLVEAVGPDECLAPMIAMLSEKYPTDNMVPSFVAELSGQFPAVTQLNAAMTYLDLIGDALQPKRVVADAVFAFADKTADQIESSIETLLTALSGLLRQRQLHNQVMRELKLGDAEAKQIESASASLLERALGLAHTVGARPHLVPACGTIVSSCFGLLPTPHFVRSALPLIKSEDDKLVLMILQSFEKRSAKSVLSDNETRISMLNALPSICDLVSKHRNSDLKHSAIGCIDHIVERYGKKDTDAALNAAHAVASDEGLGSEDARMQVNSLLCLATMVEVLGEDILSLLPQVIDRNLDLIHHSIRCQPRNERLHDAGFSLIGAILDHMAWALPARSLKRALRLCFEAAPTLETGTSNESRALFATLASQKIELRGLLTAMEDVVDAAIVMGPAACHEMLSVLRSIIDSAPKATVVQYASALLGIIRQTFDMRRIFVANETAAALSDLDMLDESRDKMLLEVIMKMNDTVYRPHFVKLYEWSRENTEADPNEWRAVSFYTFMARFLNTLKSIVTSYSTYILEDAVSILVSETSNGQLVTAVLKAATASFRHDQEDFWQDPSHFRTMSQALLARLARATTTIDANVILAVTEMAAAAASVEHHTQMNAALLKMTRSDEPAVRLAAVKCEQSLTERLGEDWLAVLPEMLPYISELQEDDDEDVERETLKWIKQMEGILGESLEGMLQ